VGLAENLEANGPDPMKRVGMFDFSFCLLVFGLMTGVGNEEKSNERIVA
jgi:hypothetical protein